jgi:demethylmenaquinone methyltransferase/2-methoxy-6-polyprenyl-1,4-benzoquinol methylase
MTAPLPDNGAPVEYSGPDSRRVQAMFAGIAHRYDFLNHFLSASIDRRWRRTAVQKVRDLTGPSGPALCLDSCSGTGDLAIALSRGLACPVIASDFCHPMLRQALGKTGGLPVRNVEADALKLPFADMSFDAVTIAFGLRNLEDPRQGLAEMARVLKAGGGLVILEFSKPVIPVMKQAFDFYFHRILPKVGAMVSGSDSAYQYLPDSVRKFPGQAELADWLRAAGFVDIDYRNLSGGIAALHWGKRGV